MYYSSNSFPQLISSTHGHANVFPPSFFPHHTSHEIFLHPNNVLQDANFNADPSPFIIDNNVVAAAAINVSDPVRSTSNKAALQFEEDPHWDPLGYSITNKKTRAKKDRHSLIFTAQGLRHRRVRLSIDIALKFFNLQDMLGFDKASQTLDWLFTNSKTAIQQLMEFSNYSLPNSSSSTSKCDEGSRSMLNSKIHRTGNEKKIKAPAGNQFIAKESREKARARARERTQQKQRIRKLEEEFKTRIPYYRNLISSNHSIRPSIENAMPVLPFSGISVVNESTWKDIIVEAIVNKKPLKSSPIYMYQQSMPVPEEIKFQSELSSHY